jgi:hypothetical protein
MGMDEKLGKDQGELEDVEESRWRNVIIWNTSVSPAVTNSHTL